MDEILSVLYLFLDSLRLDLLRGDTFIPRALPTQRILTVFHYEA